MFNPVFKDTGLHSTMVLQLIWLASEGTLNVPGLPRLIDVCLVEGLKANLISISQLCRQALFVRLNKNKCLVVDEASNCVMEGVRSTDSCYLHIPLETCLKVEADRVEL